MTPSRASEALRHAPRSPCPSCGRDSKTVQGVCADCWEPKEPGAFAPRPVRRAPWGSGDGLFNPLDDVACCSWPVLGAAAVVVTWISA